MNANAHLSEPENILGRRIILEENRISWQQQMKEKNLISRKICSLKGKIRRQNMKIFEQ